MTKDTFIQRATDEIEEAIMKAQGMMGWKPERTPAQVARDVAELLPDYIWTDE